MGAYIIIKIGLVTTGDKKGLYKISLDGDRIAYITEEKLKEKDYKIGDEFHEDIELTAEELLYAINHELQFIVKDLESANQNNAFIVLKSAINKLKQLIIEE